MSEETKTNEGAIPPRFSLKQAEATNESAPAGDTAFDAKKKTTRVEIPQPTVESATTLKKKTSRISLDFVLGDQQAGGTEAPDSAAVPKTIRIKRPTTTQSIKTLSSLMEPIPPSPASSAKSSTARIELTSEPQPEGQATQRKTIKIRRPDGTGAAAAKSIPHSMAVARLEADAEGRLSARAAEESVHMLFPIAAAVAFLILGFVVYVLLAQAFPNPSLNYPGRITL